MRVWTKAVGLLCLAGVLGVLARTAGAGDGDRARAEVLMSAVKATPSADRLVGEPIARAESALRRADNARRTGDASHAALLDALGRDWAETAQTLVAAQEKERKASELETRTRELEGQTTRERALLEETVARRGRARASLDALEASADAGAPAPIDGGRP
jgi:hypothetical protein